MSKIVFLPGAAETRDEQLAELEAVCKTIDEHLISANAAMAQLRYALDMIGPLNGKVKSLTGVRCHADDLVRPYMMLDDEDPFSG